LQKQQKNEILSFESSMPVAINGGEGLSECTL